MIMFVKTKITSNKTIYRGDCKFGYIILGLVRIENLKTR